MPRSARIAPRRPTALLVAVAAVAVLLAPSGAAAAATLPSGFTDAPVADVGAPTALGFTPDGRLLVATQPGQLRVVRDGVLLARPALDLSGRLCTNSERGLLGVAVDPAFATNRFVYVYWTRKKFGTCETKTPRAPVNRVSRFVLGGDDAVDPATEAVLVDDIASPNGNHNAGDLHFGKDGYLYVSVGDGGCDYAGGGCAGANDAARDRHVLLGKILRITRDGAIPPGNPFVGPGTARCNATGATSPGTVCQETYAWGLRNPFRMAFDPDAAGTRFFVNDVGQNLWEEVNLGRAGADYGWNAREGHCANGSTTACGPPPAGMVNPVHDYGHASGCASITGGAFVPRGVWPAAYDGAYLFGDYACGKIFSLVPASAGGYARRDFATGLGASSAVHLAFGPSGAAGRQALYYTSYAGGGQVRRITYTGAANRAPTAVVTAQPSSGPVPLPVRFDASGSTDPDGDALTYAWAFGDGTTAETATPTASHTYASAGTYTATLRVRDRRGAASAPASARVDAGNGAPLPTIDSPSADARFRVGQALTLSGRASDPQDGALPARSLSWTVLLHHADHTHPYLGPTAGNDVPLSAPAPEDLAATTSSYLEVRLTATDASGLSRTAVRELRPRLVDVTLATAPAGLRLGVNGTAVTGSRTFTSWEGYALDLSAPAAQDGADGTSYAFERWSDGGADRHRVVTPATAATYTATFRPSPGTGLAASYFDNEDFTSLRLEQVDPGVDFDWGTGSPAVAVGPETFSVRWEGWIVPRYSETYAFTTTSDDGVRLFVGNEALVEEWTDHGAREFSGGVALTAGRRYPVRMEFYERRGEAVARLSWSSPSQPRQVVPAERLYPLR